MLHIFIGQNTNLLNWLSLFWKQEQISVSCPRNKVGRKKKNLKGSGTQVTSVPNREGSAGNLKLDTFVSRFHVPSVTVSSVIATYHRSTPSTFTTLDKPHINSNSLLLSIIRYSNFRCNFAPLYGCMVLEKPNVSFGLTQDISYRCTSAAIANFASK